MWIDHLLILDIPAYTTHVPAGHLGGVRLACSMRPGCGLNWFPWDQSKIAEDFGQNSTLCYVSITGGWSLHWSGGFRQVYTRNLENKGQSSSWKFFFFYSLTVCKQICEAKRTGKIAFGKTKRCGLSVSLLNLVLSLNTIKYHVIWNLKKKKPQHTKK